MADKLQWAEFEVSLEQESSLSPTLGEDDSSVLASSESNVVSPVSQTDKDIDNDADEELFSARPRPQVQRQTLAEASSSEDENYADSSDAKKKAKRRTSSNVFSFKKVEPSPLTPSTEEEDSFTFPQHTPHNQHALNQISPLSKSKKMESSNSFTSTSGGEEERSEEMSSKNRKASAVDGLLFEIYERHHSRDASRYMDSDITECSTTSVCSVYVASSIENEDRPTLDRNYLETKEIIELEKMVRELRRGVTMLSSKLVRQLKQRDRLAHKLQENFNVMTALLQAISQKRRVDTRIRFSFIPRPGKRGFRQWIDALKSVTRIHPGIPPTWRKRTWLSLAEYHLKDTDWDSTKRNCFNDRRNPDDDELDTQIVKDLHRTGCGWFFEHDTAEDRASLKRVLLAYARWNKSVGYCQGFNVIAALILQVMGGNEEEALKVMIFVVDYVLPRSYFANNLRALSVDMAVLRDLMVMKLPYLAEQLQKLQLEAMDSKNTAASYEPPLINMFTMQWFLTLFATCLPRYTVLRIWDVILLEGSEVLLRIALAIWAKLGDYLDDVESAADFYMRMGELIQNMMDEEFINHQKLIQTVYQMAELPWTEITELREKYTYDIHPFTTFNIDKAGSRKDASPMRNGRISDEDEWQADSDDDVMAGCLGFLPVAGFSGASHHKRHIVGSLPATGNTSMQKAGDIASASPGAFLTDQEAQDAYQAQMKEKERIREVEKMDLGKLRSQYARMRRLQNKAMLVFNTTEPEEGKPVARNTPSAINHLFVDVSKVSSTRTRRHHKYPALKAPSKGVSTLKIKDDPPKDGHDKAGKSANQTSKTKQVTQLNSGMAVELKTLEDISESHFKDQDQDNKQLTTPGTIDNPISHGPNAKSKASVLSLTEDRTRNMLYQVDRKSMYPANFKPFPQRNMQPRSRLLQGKT